MSYYRSSLLTDKLLRLLSLISLGQPEVVKRHEELETSGATSTEEVQVIAGVYIFCKIRLVGEREIANGCWGKMKGKVQGEK